MAKRNGDDSTPDGLVVIYNVIGNRKVPIVFILVSSLIIANISCDQVGSSNELDLSPVASTDEFESSSATNIAVETSSGNSKNGSGNGAKYDPLSMLREIYLDHDSKVITFLSSPSSQSVQKFHPNGRYGRRSVDNFAAPGAHTELAKLRFGSGSSMEDSNNSNILRSLLQSDNNKPATWNANELDANSNNNNKQQGDLRWLLANNKKLSENPTLKLNKQQQSIDKKLDYSPSTLVDSSSINYRSELNKLLKCNYSGVSNLFWCDS